MTAKLTVFFQAIGVMRFHSQPKCASLRNHMQRDFEILSSRYGPFQTIALEFPFDDDDEQKHFFHGQFYPALRERGWLDDRFSHVMYSDAHNLKTIERDGEISEMAAQAPRPGMLVYREKSQLPGSCAKGAVGQRRRSQPKATSAQTKAASITG